MKKCELITFGTLIILDFSQMLCAFYIMKGVDLYIQTNDVYDMQPSGPRVGGKGGKGANPL